MLDQFKKDFETCNTCPSLCQSACPVFSNDGNKAHSPWGIMQTLNLVRQKQLPFKEDVASLTYQCLTCKGCQTQCDHEVDVPAVLQEARFKAVKNNIAPNEIKGFLEKFHRHNNPFSRDLSKKLSDIVEKLKIKPNSNFTYYPSCGIIAKSPQVIEDTFHLFKKLDIDFVEPFTDPIQCCGYPLLSAGSEYEFVDLAEINYHSLKNYKTIIVGAPACAHTLKNVYAKYDFNLKGQVVTISEFLEPFIKNINFKVKKNIKTNVMFHDPCYLSRYLNQVDTPRELIGQVTGDYPVDFFEHGTRTKCSGQGGCYSIVEKDHADEITKTRLQECKDNKIKTVITHCPTCLFKMRNNSKNMVIKDLVSYLNDCISGKKE